MKYALGTLSAMFISLALYSVAPSQEIITEEYVVNILDGERKKAIAAQPPGYAFSLVYSPDSAKAVERGTARADKEGGRNEEFYKKLIPLARALESDVLRGVRFIIIVRPDPSNPEDRDESLSLRVAEEVKYFLTTYFAIASEGLSIKGVEGLAPSTPRVQGSAATRRWEVEVMRLE
jgi:hypothetical protein